MAVTGVQLFANNAQTTLAGNISAVATTANLQSGAGALFPDPGANQYFLMTFVDALTGTVNEIVKVTGIAGDTITSMVRGQEGTEALPWLANDIAANFMTAGTADNFAQPRDTQLQAGNYGVDSGTANAMVIALPVNPSTLAGLIGTDIRVTKGAAANTGGVTLAIGAFAATAVVDLQGNPLGAGALPAGCTFTAIYDGTHFVLQSSVGGGASSGRVLLTNDITFFVATTGNDSNDGLTSGTPWLTLQHAQAVIFGTYDLGGFEATISVAAGTYTAGLSIAGTIPGQGRANLIVSGAAASTTIISTSSNCFSATNGANIFLEHLTVESSAAGGGVLFASQGGSIIFSDLIFGASGSSIPHMIAENNGVIQSNTNYAISGGARAHIEAEFNGTVNITAGTITLSGTPAFTHSFAFATDCGVVAVDSTAVIFGGTGATGKIYDASLNGVIDSNGGGGSFFPGNVAGTTATGGQYG